MAVAWRLENATKLLLARAALIPGGRMGSEALETLDAAEHEEKLERRAALELLALSYKNASERA